MKIEKPSANFSVHKFKPLLFSLPHELYGIQQYNWWHDM